MRVSVGERWVSYTVVLQPATAQHRAVAKPSVHAGNKELKAVGAAIREYRRALGVSQELLAHDAGVDRSYMGGIERGEHNFALINLLKISACLGVRPSELFAAAGL
jgi:DNA-binding XRE family transcriptional regulator